MQSEVYMSKHVTVQSTKQCGQCPAIVAQSLSVCLFTRLLVSSHPSSFSSLHTRTHTWMLTCTCVHSRTHTHSRTHARTHARTHTHTHTCMDTCMHTQHARTQAHTVCANSTPIMYTKTYTPKAMFSGIIQGCNY